MAEAKSQSGLNLGAMFGASRAGTFHPARRWLLSPNDPD